MLDICCWERKKICSAEASEGTERELENTDREKEGSGTDQKSLWKGKKKNSQVEMWRYCFF